MSGSRNATVVKRDGSSQRINLNKILTRMQTLIEMEPPLDFDVNQVLAVVQEVIAHFRNGISTTELDEIACKQLAHKSAYHVQHHALAARIFISDLQKNVQTEHAKHGPPVDYGVCDLDTVNFLSLYESAGAELHPRFISRLSEDEWIETRSCITPSRDFLFELTGATMLSNKYLWRTPDERHIETPQLMYYRMALFYADAPCEVGSVYDALSLHQLSFPTPAYFNTGLKSGNCNPCFLGTIAEDSIDGIAQNVVDSMKISKHCGGYGLSFLPIRSNGSLIRSAPNARSGGIVNFANIFNSVGRGVNQGGKRKGSIALYLNPWHADIYEFLDLRKVTGKEERRARDLFYGLMIPDLFMERCEAGGMWSLFNPDDVQDLVWAWGDDFRQRYEAYEKDGTLVKRTVKAQDLLHYIYRTANETGMPYMIFEDAVNSKSNQKHIGKIQCSNLCTEGKLFLRAMTFVMATCT